jgi:hypothetical protein
MSHVGRCDELVDEVSRLIRSELRRLSVHVSREDLEQEVWCELLAGWDCMGCGHDPARGFAA